MLLPPIVRPLYGTSTRGDANALPRAKCFWTFSPKIMELLPLFFTQWFFQELVFAIVRSYLRTINDDDLATNLL